MKRIGGFRRKTRYKMRQSISNKGKLPVSKFMQEFEIGERVVLKAEPSYQGGLFFLRFQGKVGDVIKKQGECLLVNIKDGKKAKKCLVHPVHLQRI
ncbi:MAG: 50S ribosomal protein L21e [Candidatus Nanoarchaeia archaeon]